MDAKTYFYNEVMYGVELEHGYWETVKGENLQEFLKPYKEVSDIDFQCYQPNSFVNRVMKLAELNFYKNSEWCKKHNLTSYFGVIDFILENGLWKVQTA